MLGRLARAAADKLKERLCRRRFQQVGAPKSHTPAFAATSQPTRSRLNAMSLPRDLNQTTAADIQALVDNAVPEGSHLDFKRDLPGRDEAGRGALVGDACAFANAAGGDLVYGIDEDGEGRAARVTFARGNPDEEARRIADMLAHGVEPRIPGVQVLAVPMPDGFVVVVRIPQSWAGPHRARTNQHFYVREGARNRKLDIPEIRGLFLRSENQAQRLRDFRTERLGQLVAGLGPVRLVPGPALVLHLVPTQAALATLSIDPVPYSRERLLPALGANVPAARLNLDGALAVRHVDAHGRSHGYTQLFRSGFFETVKALSMMGQAWLGAVAYERDLIRLLQEFRRELALLGIGTEMTCMLSVLQARDVIMGLDQFRFDLEEHQGRFDRDMLVLPDVLLPADTQPEVALRPVFDLVWQAAGMARSFNYNEAGEWIGDARR
jgi:hypothetical protein